MPRHEACNFIKKETLTPQVFFVNFCEISNSTFFADHLQMTAPDSNTGVFL